jgi:hypothetical protein
LQNEIAKKQFKIEKRRVQELQDTIAKKTTQTDTQPAAKEAAEARAIEGAAPPPPMDQQEREGVGAAEDHGAPLLSLFSSRARRRQQQEEEEDPAPRPPVAETTTNAGAEEVGSGRIVVSETEAPNILANLV